MDLYDHYVPIYMYNVWPCLAVTASEGETSPFTPNQSPTAPPLQAFQAHTASLMNQHPPPPFTYIVTWTRGYKRSGPKTVLFYSTRN